MAKCKDPFVTALKKHGYNLVRLPKSDLKPSQLLVRSNGSLRRLGELSSVFNLGAAPFPQVSADNPGPNLTVSKTSDLKLGFGLSILSGLIGALGGGTLGIGANYARARTVSLEASDIKEANISMAVLDQFLTQSDLNPFSRAVNEMLEDDDVYVITSVIKSRKLIVETKDENGAGVNLDVPVIKGAVGGKLTVNSVGAGASKIAYEGEIPLVFGFQAVRLGFENGTYQTMKAANAGLGLESMEAAESAKGGNVLIIDGLVGSL